MLLVLPWRGEGGSELTLTCLFPPALPHTPLLSDLAVFQERLRVLTVGGMETQPSSLARAALDGAWGFSQHALGEVHTAVSVWKCVCPSLGCGPQVALLLPSCLLHCPSVCVRVRVRFREHLRLPCGALAALPLAQVLLPALRLRSHCICMCTPPPSRWASAGLCTLSGSASRHQWQGFPFGVLIKHHGVRSPYWPWARLSASEGQRGLPGPLPVVTHPWPSFCARCLSSLFPPLCSSHQ